MKKLKIVFAGTEYFSAEHLHALITSSHDVISVITQPDRYSGRGQKITFSPVKILSLNNGIPIFQPENLNDTDFQNKLLKLNADIMTVVSYGKIIPKKILNMFSKGCINVHASLLPRWRGATPIQSSILHGDKKTGISIIQMNDEIDSGNIMHSITCSISSKDTTKTLSLKLIKIGIEALLEVLEKIILNTVIYKKQNEKNVILSKKIYKKDALLDWNLSAEKLERLIRAFNPWPICYFLSQNKNIKVWQSEVIPITQNNRSVGEIISYNKNGIQINTSHQILNIKKLQFPGKKIIDVKNVIISKKKLFKIGTIL
ncbi:methionyl-tRNA formyltransferase [Buchnera aphidicola str. APS (Acyrthosiphon pisum)]|uniref:Methionyl-tRNA formyltransferase n=3 Tax=Buchnera aphidicola TaxID=9 RepID=FMT_BUCAI|nr:methionyl-tRNA formyltransferase [Buchnera aphidicola]B8D822.1 RecName: Full=Methionyl-tRNA formyltransferase [Buchnera aphidicola str. Tuc7 (Acyrthosiphon pisum)]B8D9S0.1 RecName: Full=Methionyl-tRNA formyltransferase [Buchnera aphidicola str. 5A (Acyrthosiphon pisum)]P57564.1 RecName: Full=Methionyl-tRNA formyltransferase [Buchnera aphidicola str. APS (Acyrthosiphon pisum)]pir/F84987/ methionyl-tRNA formyltransferase (EC 2.1.2.9) [imported] - Buchnera sp. (strain APS) [Buchnera sp. (in: en